MTRRQLESVLRDANADGNLHRVSVVYHKKTTGRTVTRHVRPYEIRGGVFWGTDTLHGAQRIHKFYTRRILDATPEEASYRPVWAVQIPGGDEAP